LSRAEAIDPDLLLYTVTRILHEQEIIRL
jgi:hypothetical protein